MSNMMVFLEDPPPDELPENLQKVESMVNHLEQQNMPGQFLDLIIAGLVALTHTMQHWMWPVLGDLEPDEIREYGPRIDHLDTLTTALSDNLYKYQDGPNFIMMARAIITEIRNLWDFMDKKGYVEKLYINKEKIYGSE